MIAFEKEEKKVEYLELIYDLIFVYLIGRNNSLLNNLENGFVPGGVFLSYILCTLAVVQIWNYSTFYINLYGRNGLRDHVFLFINMYLLYHMADGISTGWQTSFYQFCGSWFLILVNIGIQHLIEMQNHRDTPWMIRALGHKAAIIFAEAGLVIVHMIVFTTAGISIAWVPILFGIGSMVISEKTDRFIPADFMHLSERAMLYVVFTFGEMIISISAYFTEKITPNMLYFSLMAFLIVAALFLCYEVVYNEIIDREQSADAVKFMLIHIFLIFALNNISVSLGFMREESVALLPKTLFLTSSFILYFVFLFLTGFFAKNPRFFDRRFVCVIAGLGVSFFALMLLFRAQMKINIAITVLYAFGVFLLLYWRGTKEAASS